LSLQCGELELDKKYISFIIDIFFLSNLTSLWR